MHIKTLFFILISVIFSSCKNDENVVKNNSDEKLNEYIVTGEISKKTTEFPSPWKSDSYFVDITYPELKTLYDNIKEPNFCKHYIIVETSCGTGCQQGFMIDVRTGEHYELPRPSIEEWEGNGNIRIEYNVQYNLLIEHQELLMEGDLLACSASWEWDENLKKFSSIYPVIGDSFN
jgi:hypothetical protein